MKKKRRKKGEFPVIGVKASAERGGSSAGGAEVVDGGGGDSKSGTVGRYTSSAMEVTTFNQSFTGDTEFPVWEKIGAVVRLSYGIGK